MQRLPFLCVVLAAAVARAQSPAITHVAPSAATPGRAIDVTVHGGSLANPVAVWTTFPAETSFPADKPQAADRVTCRLVLPPDVQPGVHALRLATRNGVSNLHLFVVDDLPTAPQATGNTSPATARPLSPPVAVDGACDAGASGYFRIPAKKGQRISVEVVAARTGSPLDPVLRLLDPSGRELAWSDDAPGAGADARFAHAFAADGEYLLELRDTNYAGGPDFRYRLRLGDFPVAPVPMPLAAKRGGVAMFTFADEDGAAAAPVTLVPPNAAGAVALGVPFAGARGAAGGSAFASALIGDRDESVEAEPNDDAATASPLAVPSAVSGRLGKSRDRDYYKLAAAKGQRLLFRARARSLGSPCDVLMQLYKPDGSKLAESKVEAGTGEGSLDATAPEAGVYRLSVEDIAGAGGPALAYRVDAAPHRPSFALSVEADRVEAKPGESFQLKVTCARRDYAGPVALSVKGIDGLKLESATIDAGKNETTLKATLPPDYRPAGVPHVRITGTARIAEADFTAVASTMPALRKQFPRLLYPPELTDGLIAVGVRQP